MATNKIKGLTVKIGADTSDFIKELKKVDKEINTTQKTANELQKGLELKFNSSRFLEAQKQVRNALKETEEKAKAIREQLKYLEETGGVDTEGYQRLQTELAKAETQALKLNDQLKQLDKIQLKNANKSITDLGNSIETAGKKTAILSAAAAGAIAGIVKLGKDAVKTGDELQTTATQYNLSAEAIQRWNYVAMQSDVSSEQLYKGITKVRDAIGTALVGQTNNATKAISELTGDISKIPTDTEGAFQTIIIELSKVEDKTLQAYYANEIFGERIATNLIPLLNQGASGLSKFNAEFEAVGYLSNEQVKNLSDFDNQLNMINQQVSNAKTELGIALLPLLKSLADILTNVIVPMIKNVADWFNKLSPTMQKIITGTLLLVASLSPLLIITGKLIKTLPSLINLVKSFRSATLKTTLGVASLAAAMGLVFDLIGNWSQMSTLEKVLKSLALAFLVAAAAVTVFHASWSLGLAVGAIAAAVVAGVAAINAAGKSIGIDTNFSDSGSLENNLNSNYNVPSESRYGSYSEDNSTYNIDINLNSTGDLNYDAKELANEVIKQIQVAKQSSGR